MLKITQKVSIFYDYDNAVKIFIQPWCKIEGSNTVYGNIVLQTNPSGV